MRVVEKDGFAVSNLRKNRDGLEDVEPGQLAFFLVFWYLVH